MCITEYNEEETMQMFKEEARAEGVQAGEDKLGQLIERLISSGRSEDVQKAATDKVVRRTLYKEYNIN